MDKNDKSAEEHSEGGPNISIPEGDYARYLADYAARLADEKASKREGVYRSVFGVLLTLLAFLGYTNISSLKHDLRKDITEEVSEKHQQAIEGINTDLGNIQKNIEANITLEFDNRITEMVALTTNQIRSEMDAKIAYIELLLIAKEMKDIGVKSIQQRDNVLEQIGVAAQYPEIKNSAGFKEAVKEVLNSFLLSDLLMDVESLEDQIGDSMLESYGIVEILVEHFGFRVVGDAELKDEYIEDFNKYATAMKRLGYPEFVLPYEIALQYRLNGNSRNTITDNLFEDASHFEAGPLNNFLDDLDYYAHGEMGNSLGQLVRVADVFTGITRDYESEIFDLENPDASQ